MRSLRRQTTLRVTAGRLASHGRKALPISLFCRNGMNQRSTRRRSGILQPGLQKNPSDHLRCPRAQSGTAHGLDVKMAAMRCLAIVALFVAGTAPALAQNAPPTDGYPPPAAGAAGNAASYGPPGLGIIPEAPGPPFH